jgi:hypothetical protein
MWLQSQPAGNITVVYMHYHGNAAHFLAMGDYCSFMIPALGYHAKIYAGSRNWH